MCVPVVAVFAPLQAPDAVHVVAFATVHVSVDEPPGGIVMLVGNAKNETEGGVGGGVLTETGVDGKLELPAASSAMIL